MTAVGKFYISQIRPHRTVHCQLLLSEKELRTAKSGNAYLTVKLTDKTGQIVGRMWERAEQAYQDIAVGEVVSLQARSELFRNELQLNISEMHPVAASEVDPADYLPQCPLDADDLWEELKRITASVNRTWYRKLLVQVTMDGELMARFKKAPAAKTIHHAYLGGLLEHSVSVARLVDRLCDHYGSLDLDRDLLVTAALLHDIGKIDELTYDLIIDYSDVGRLIGHTVLGCQIVERQVRSMKRFPEADAVLLMHLILSHHGQAEFGAASVPMTREAFLLHYADDVDAKMNHLSRLLNGDTEDDRAWTAYQPLYGRFLYKGTPRPPQKTAAAPQAGAVSPPPAPEAQQLSLWPVTGTSDRKAARSADKGLEK